MKKAFAIIFLLAIFAVTPIFAENSRDLQEDTAFFLSLLNDNALEAVNAEGGDFALKFVTWLYEWKDSPLGFDGYNLEERAERLNNSPYEMESILSLMKDEHMWYAVYAREELAEEFAFGDDFTREDIAAIFEALVDHYSKYYFFDFIELMELAGLSHDDAIEFMSLFIAAYDANDVVGSGDKESWVFNAMSFLISEFERIEKTTESKAVLLRLFADVTQILGYQNARSFIFPYVDRLAELLGDELIYSIIANNFQFTETFESFIAEHGVDDFMAFFWRNSITALHDFFESGVKTQDIIFLDTLLNGIISEKTEELIVVIEERYERNRLSREARAAEEAAREAEWRERQAEWRKRSAVLDAIEIMERHRQETYVRWATLNNVQLLDEETTSTLSREDLERRFSSGLSFAMQHKVVIECPEGKINIFLQNDSDSPVTFMYFAFDSFNEGQTETVEIQEGQNFTTQISIPDFFERNFWVVEVFMFASENTQLSGEFAFRLTEHPLEFIRNE